MEPLLNRVTCPVVIVHGTWDAVCPHDSTAAYLRLRLGVAARVDVVSLERIGHNIHLSDPGVVAQGVRSNVADIGG